MVRELRGGVSNLGLLKEGVGHRRLLLPRSVVVNLVRLIDCCSVGAIGAASLGRVGLRALGLQPGPLALARDGGFGFWHRRLRRRFRHRSLDDPSWPAPPASPASPAPTRLSQSAEPILPGPVVVARDAEAVAHALLRTGVRGRLLPLRRPGRRRERVGVHDRRRRSSGRVGWSAMRINRPSSRYLETSDVMAEESDVARGERGIARHDGDQNRFVGPSGSVT